MKSSLLYIIYISAIWARSCPPEGKLSLGIRTNKTLLEALQEEPWLISEWLRKKITRFVCAL